MVAAFFAADAFFAGALATSGFFTVGEGSVEALEAASAGGGTYKGEWITSTFGA